jgi:multiple sugar transport system permease protein
MRAAVMLRWMLLAAALLLALFPFYWMVNTSLKPITEVMRSPPGFISPNWSFGAYATVFATRPVLRWFANSLVVALGSTAIALVLSVLAAYGLTRFFVRGAGAIVVALLFTKMLPETLLVIPYFQIMSELGLIDTHLALILVYSSFSVPFAVWMLVGFFRTIPREIDEAALVDGATRLTALWRAVLPMAAPGLVAVGLFTFLLAWNSYVWALVLTTDSRMYVLSVGVATMIGEYRVQWNELMAAAVVAALPVMLLYSLLDRHLVSGLTAGAVKG